MPSSRDAAMLDVPERRLRLPLARQAVDPMGRVSPLLPPSEAEYGSIASWPIEAAFILSALDAGREPSLDRRVLDRTLYRTTAELKLFSDDRDRSPWILYTRDVATRGIGFITRHQLPLGYGGMLRLRGPKGEELSIDCTVRRCRQTVNGWFDGALSFNREQWPLGGENFLDVPEKSAASAGTGRSAHK